MAPHNRRSKLRSRLTEARLLACAARAASSRTRNTAGFIQSQLTWKLVTLSPRQGESDPEGSGGMCVASRRPLSLTCRDSPTLNSFTRTHMLTQIRMTLDAVHFLCPVPDKQERILHTQTVLKITQYLILTLFIYFAGIQNKGERAFLNHQCVFKTADCCLRDVDKEFCIFC